MNDDMHPPWSAWPDLPTGYFLATDPTPDDPHQLASVLTGVLPPTITTRTPPRLKTCLKLARALTGNDEIRLWRSLDHPHMAVIQCWRRFGPSDWQLCHLHFAEHHFMQQVQQVFPAITHLNGRALPTPIATAQFFDCARFAASPITAGGRFDHP